MDERKSLLDTCVKHLNYEREDLATYDGRQRRDRATPRPPPSHHRPTTVPPPDCRVDACVDRVPQPPDTKSNVATRHGACHIGTHCSTIN